MDPTALAWAQAQAAGSEARNLASAFLSGALIVRSPDGRHIEYRTLDELGRAIESAYSAAVTVTARRPGTTLAGFSRGW